MADIHRWEIVEYSVHPPVDQLVIEEILDRLRQELGDRWRHSSAVETTVGSEGELVFRYRKARS